MSTDQPFTFPPAGAVVSSTPVTVAGVSHVVEVMESGEVRVRAETMGSVVQESPNRRGTLVVFDTGECMLVEPMVVESVAGGLFLFKVETPTIFTLVGAAIEVEGGLRLMTESGEPLAMMDRATGRADVALRFRAEMRARYALHVAGQVGQAALRRERPGPPTMINRLGS